MTPGDDVAVPFAAMHETHIGVVFLVGELAYKLKKPVRTAFLDYCLEFDDRLRYLVLVGGTPGTGKSTVSDAVAARLGMVLLSSDRVRKELHGLPPQQSAAAAYGEGLYSPAVTERTYAELLNRAADCLAQGESVVLDASWTRAGHRAAAAELVCRAHAELVALHCAAPPEVVAQRLRERTGSVSDADEAIGRAVAAHADPWPEAVPLDTSGSLDDTVQRALTALGES